MAVECGHYVHPGLDQHCAKTEPHNVGSGLQQCVTAAQPLDIVSLS